MFERVVLFIRSKYDQNAAYNTNPMFLQYLKSADFSNTQNLTSFPFETLEKDFF